MTEPRSDWALGVRLWAYVRRHPRWLWAVALATPIGVASQLVQPYLLKVGIDTHIAQGDIAGLGRLAALFAVVVTVGFVVRSLGLYGLQHIGLAVLTDLRRDLFGHVMDQGQSFFDRRTTGNLMTRTTSDVEAVFESLAFGAVGLISDALFIVGTAAVMLLLDWKLTLVAFALSPVVIYVVDLFRRRLRVLFSGIRVALSDLNGFFAEQVDGMSVVQLYGAEESSETEFRRQAHLHLDLYRQANWWDAGLYAIMDGLGALAVGLMIAYGAYQFGVEGSGVTLGLLVAFVDYLGKVFVPIRMFSGRIATIQRAVAALERIFDLLDVDERVKGGDAEGPVRAGGIVFEGVTFGYGDGAPVLHDLSFKVAAGEVVALVGATGSGKSTVGKLLLRMYDGYEGQISLDGRELSTLPVETVRRAVTVVHQDPHLFDASVAENISLWAPEVDEAAMIVAATRARAAAFVEALPAGYAHKIAERGANVSAGQRQLISMARAMARPAPIVVLDEATASVDALTEHLIDEAVAALFAERTVLVIAHRLSTIAKADRILVLHHGRLVESGTHTELLAQGGRYKLLVETGFAV